MKKIPNILKTSVSILALLVLIFLTRVSYATVNRNIDSLLQQYYQDEDQLHANEYFDLIVYQYHNDSLFRTMELARKGIIKAKEEENYYVLGNIYNIKGYVHLGFGTYLKSIDFFSKGEQVGIQHKIPQVILGAKHGMGRVYNEIGEYDKALKVLKEGLELIKKDSTTKFNNTGALYNAIGVSLQKTGDFNGALTYFDKFYSLSEQAGDTISMIYALVNTGESYRLDSNYNKAIEYYNKAQELNKGIKNPQAEAAVYGNLASIYSSRGDRIKAKEFLKKSIRLCSENNGLSNFLIMDYKAIVDEFAKSLQYDSAYFYYKKYIVLLDSVSEMDRIHSINKLRSEYKIQQKEAEQKILSQKLRNQTLIMNFSIALSILIIFLLLVIYSRYKLKTKILKEEAKALTLTIDEKNRQLVTRVMGQDKQMTTNEELEKSLKRLKKSDDIDEIKNNLDVLVKKLSQNEKTGMDWNSFKLHFEQVHPDFFNKLLKINSVLTANDLRLLGYIKLNLSTKDIANILNVSDRTVQTSRYRIKKKLNLPADVNLVRFIQSL